MTDKYKKNGYTCECFYEQYQVLAATEGVAITKIRTDTEYDVAWELTDGRIVGLEISKGGCPTCGDYGGDTSWWLLTPKVPRG